MLKEEYHSHSSLIPINLSTPNGSLSFLSHSDVPILNLMRWAPLLTVWSLRKLTKIDLVDPNRSDLRHLDFPGIPGKVYRKRGRTTLRPLKMNQLATKPKWRKKEGKNHSKVSNQQHSTKRVSTVKSAEESSAAIQPQVSRAWRNWYVFNHTTGFLKQAIFTYFAEKSSFTFILHFLLPLHCIVLLLH